jgi:diguanylate cyclase (GGDEF)-like protein
MQEKQPSTAAKRPSFYRDLAAPAAGPLLAFVVTLMRVAGDRELSDSVVTPLLFLAVVMAAALSGRWPALATAALAAFGLVLGSDENDPPRTALAIGALLATALGTGELRDRADRADRAVEVANQRLQRVALRDALTGLLDRRGFEFAMGVEIARETRRNGTFALLLLDLSGVRVANERFGQSVGDTLIQVLADAIEQRIRQSDIPARVADHQFAVILPDTNTSGTEVIARSILSSFQEELRAVAPSGLVARGSFAISLFPGDGRDVNGLLTGATRRLEDPSSSGTFSGA